MTDDSVVVKFGANIGELTEAVGSANELLESLGETIRHLRPGFSELGEAIAVTFAVESIHGFMEGMAELGTEITHASAILGVSKEQVAGLDLLARASGGSLDQLQTAFGRLSENVINQSDTAKRAVAALGLTFDQIRNKTPQQQLELLAEKFAGIKDGSDKSAIAIALLGRSGENLIPVFNQGAEGIRKWFETSQELEPALARNVESMEQMHMALTEMDAAIQGFKIEQTV
jgi:hypothetical protein